MRRIGATRAAVLAAFREHGRLTDAVLVWLMGIVGIGPGAARAARYQLVRLGKVRFYRWRLDRTGKKRPEKIWELVEVVHHAEAPSRKGNFRHLAGSKAGALCGFAASREPVDSGQLAVGSV